MFDANMSYLPVGTEFFAEIHWMSEEHILRDYGYKDGDIALCTMLESKEEVGEYPLVVFHTDTGDVEVSGSYDFYESLFIYSGKKDLTGFIQQAWLDKAIKLLEERK